MADNGKLILINHHAKALADASLLLFWSPENDYHRSEFERMVANLNAAIEAVDAPEAIEPKEDF